MVRQSKLNKFIEKKTTYSQDWPAYNMAQTSETRLMMQLLYDLMNQINYKPVKRKGHPFLYVPDLLFCCGLKLYFQMPSRRLISILKVAKELGYIQTVPHFNTILNYLKRKELTPILKELLTLSSLPLKEVEKKFAVDATGFSTNQYESWLNVRTASPSKRSKFVKVHAMCGVFTNILTSLEITGGHRADSPQFAPLVNKTADYFEMDEVSADKAYSSRSNVDLVWRHGGWPYIPFKSNATGTSRSSTMWVKCYNYFKNWNEDFEKYYHKRSNVESTFSAMKRKFGSKLYTRNFVSQTNELYLKSICYNISILIHSIFELGIKIDLNKCARDIPAQHLAI